MSVPLLTFSSCCFISFILFLLSAAGWKRERSSAVRFPADGSNSGSKTPWRVKDADVNSLNNRNPKAKFQGNTRRTRIELDFFRPAAVESSEIETQHNYTAIAPPILCRFEMLHANRLAITRRIEASIGTTYTTAETCNPFDAVEIRGCPFGRVVSRTELNRSLRRKWVHWTEKGNPSSRNKKIEGKEFFLFASRH